MNYPKGKSGNKEFKKEEYLSKEEILKGIENGAKEIRLYLDGKIKLKDAKGLLKEL